MTAREAEIIELIRKEVKPALGCTEPIAVALAVAKAMEIIEDKCCPAGPGWRFGKGYSLNIEVSGNILKNGMGVGIPGTGMVGLHIAAALGAVCGKSSYGLEVLHDLDAQAIACAKEMVEEKLVTVGLADTDHKLFVKASVTLMGKHSASAVIEDDHDRIVETSYDESVLTSSHGVRDIVDPSGEVKCPAGLCVIGTERHEARRIDNQLRGRSGRQGDPGYSRFFVSCDDELMIRFAPDYLRTLFEKMEDEALESKMVMNAITSAQKKIEGVSI